MGMYTQVFCAAVIDGAKHPKEVEFLDVLVNDLPLLNSEDPEDGRRAMREYEEAYTKRIPDHPFFRFGRWLSIFCGGHRYFNSSFCLFTPQRGSMDTYEQWWRFSTLNSLKNYNDEIEYFFDWLAPLVEPEQDLTYLGYSMYEDTLPTAVMLDSTTTPPTITYL